MDGSIKSVQGIAEKIPATLTSPVMIRVILPGLLVSTLLYPFVHNLPAFWNVLLTLKISGTTYSLQWGPLLLSLSSLVWGIAITSSNSFIYGVYSGRSSLWPSAVTSWMVRRREAKVKALLFEAEKLRRGKKYNQLWYKLRAYSIGEDGDPHALSPTYLGDILKEFEGYPKSRYGMDGSFYWKRIWLSLDKDRRKEIDSKWCIGDGLLYIAAICNSGGILWILTALAGFIARPLPKYLPFYSRFGSLWGGLTLLLAAFLVYRISLLFHRSNGDIFKMVFDLYRPQVLSLLTWGSAESRRWRGAWAYLQYLRIECAICKNSYLIRLSRCDCCNYLTELSVRALLDPKNLSVAPFAKPATTASISRRAYEIYQGRQAREGFALEDWLQAENELVDNDYN
jgi:hypothetical protein